MRLLLTVVLLLSSSMILVGADEEECKPETTLVLLKPDAVRPAAVTKEPGSEEWDPGDTASWIL